MHRNRRRMREFNYRRLDPSKIIGTIRDPDIFYGPITVAELKWTTENAPLWIKQRKEANAKKKAEEALKKKAEEEALKKKAQEEAFEEATSSRVVDECTQSNVEHELNSTYDADNESHPLNSTYDMDDKENQNEMDNKSALNTTYELLDPVEDINLKTETTMLPPACNFSASKHTYRNRMEQTLISETSRLDNTLSTTLQTETLVDITNGDQTISSYFRELKLDKSVMPFKDSPLMKKQKINNTIATGLSETFYMDPVGSITLANTSTLMQDTICEQASAKKKRSIRPVFNTPAAGRVRKSEFSSPTVGSARKVISKIDQTLLKEIATPSKISITPIEDLRAENILVASPLPEAFCSSNKSQRTPEIFNESSRNSLWEQNKPSVKKTAGGSSKIPQRKSTFVAESPVAKYISHGIKIESMSKSRHSTCVEEKCVKSASKIPLFKSCAAVPSNRRAKLFKTPTKSQKEVLPQATGRPKYFNNA